ncbi:MAG: cobalt/nickel transport system permease protein [Clostridia bacterium]|nr:cobalt/nickel transport system permease protein [Clostridia bacterium]
MFQGRGFWASQVDPRVKIAAIFLCLVVISSLRTWKALAWAFVFLFLLNLASGVTWRRILTGLAWVLPFAAGLVLFLPWVTPGEVIWRWPLGWPDLALTKEGLEAAFIYSGRLGAAALATGWLAATTGQVDLLAGLRGLGLPWVFCQVVALTLRYLEVMAAELRRMQLAHRARGYRTGKGLWQFAALRQLGFLVGMLFWRSLKRAERVYLAAAARGGYRQYGHSLSLKAADYWVGITLLSFSAFLLLMERGSGLWPGI